MRICVSNILNFVLCINQEKFATPALTSAISTVFSAPVRFMTPPCGTSRHLSSAPVRINPAMAEETKRASGIARIVSSFIQVNGC